MRNPINQLIKQKKFLLKSQGRSMLPTIHPDDVMYLKRINSRNILINDIILVRKGQRSFIHRVVYKNDEYLVTKGDNNQKSDGKVYPYQVIGKAYQIKRTGQVFNPQDINLFQSTLYFQEIVKVKKIFEKEGINFVFLKGLPIHLFFEGKHPSRIYADCDILIEKKRRKKVSEILLNLGYNSLDPSLSTIHRILRKKVVEQSFYKKIQDFPVVFDVHLEIDWMSPQIGRLEEFYPQKLIDEMTEEFLRTKRKIMVQNESFLILNTYCLILYLALHFFHHNFRGIHRLEMIDKVIRRSLHLGGVHSATPGVFITLTKKILAYRVRNFVYPVFLMLKKYFDTPLPGGFLNSIKPEEDKLRYIGKNIMKINVFDDEPRVQAGISRFKNIFFLSPEPMYKKIFVFLSPAVAYSIFWVVYKKIKSYFVVTFAPNSLARARK